jgi:Ca2+-binding EF-hand superfamily protein
MRKKNFLLIFLLALGLAAPAAMADPSPGAMAYAKDNQGKEKNKRKDKGHKWKDDDRDHGRENDDRNHRGAQGIPPGHLPPSGECRVWYNGKPPGHQPPSTDCSTARREAARNGGRVIYGDNRRDDRWDDNRWTREFDSFDRNRDGYLSSREWTGDDRIFDRLDVNNDNRLSRNEIRDARSRYQDNLEDRFRESDDNRDRRLSQREWWGRDEVFERLDRNNDGYLAWAELVDRRSSR